MKSANAPTRHPVPPVTRKITKNGTMIRRSTVSALAALTTLGWDGTG